MTVADKRIKSPFPGTFYRSSSPEAEPFVSEGQLVEAGDVVGLVEVMKSFYEVRAEDGGMLDRFLVESEEMVEADQDIATMRSS
jgi:acetyl-CoA carboxylase biotin carboxyl carrier protein